MVKGLPGRPNQLSDSCLHSTMDASQIKDGLFNFRGELGLLVFFSHIDVEARAHGYLRAWL